MTKNAHRDDVKGIMNDLLNNDFHAVVETVCVLRTDEEKLIKISNIISSLIALMRKLAQVDVRFLTLLSTDNGHAYQHSAFDRLRDVDVDGFMTALEKFGINFSKYREEVNQAYKERTNITTNH